MLASLELFGFKSFADRTTLEFAPGVTAVVGPNGSGKSNVVDAIKWVLGDQSAKSLRGKEMTDVIFNGATGRKPNHFAEATLAFDNRSGFLPTSDVDVRVGRRLWRNGDSEYLLNDQVVRLKDVRDLFLGTGAGASAYAIIEQGRVDQILQANAVGRRAVFEEAAGISRYKGKRVDALRRLERVEQNLLRLTDIVDEVETQLHATRTQAVKAAKHREVSKELDGWWMGLAGDDYRHISAQLTTLETSLAEQQAQLDGLSAEQAALDAELRDLDGELARADEARRAAEKQCSTAREAIAGHEAAAKHQTARLEELESELVRLRKQFTSLAARAQESANELEHNVRVLASSESDLAQRQAALAANLPELEELARRAEADREQIAKDRRLQLERLKQVSDAEKRIAAMTAERDSVAASLQTVETKLTSVDRDVADAEAIAAQKALAVEEAAAAVRVRTGRTADLHSAREKLARDGETLVAEIASLREKKSATSARIAVLADLQERGEGFGIGVREILRRARSLSEAPWNRIYGTVADLLDVDLDDAPLLEVALGERAQFIVIDDFQSLIPYLERSSAKLSGRVGFFSQRGLPTSDEPELTGVRYIEAYPKQPEASRDSHPPFATAAPIETQSSNRSPADRDDLRGLPGVLRRADELVRSSSRMPHLATRLLSDTWVVESLAAAIRLAQGFGRDLRFVTLSGELLDSDGTLVVGPLRPEAAIVSRRSELHRLRAELTEISAAIEAAANRQDTLTASQASLTAKLSLTDAEVRAAVDRLNRAKSEQAEASLRRQQLADTRRQVAEELEQHQARHAETSERIRKVTDERDSAASDLETLETGLSLALAAAAELEKRQAAIEQKRSAEHLEFAKAEERLANLRNAVGRLEREAAQRTAQLADAGRRLDVSFAKRSEITRHLLNTQSLLAEAMLELESLSKTVAQAVKSHDALKGRRTQFAQRESELRSRRRIAVDARHAAELTDRELRQRLTTLSERIREDYGREVHEIANEGHSAISSWLAEREQHASDSPAGQESAPDEISTAAAAASTHFTVPPYAELRPELEAIVERLRKKLKMMGAVNTDSLADLDELEERHSRLSGQLQDLVEAKRTLEDVIRRINAESKRLFAETFESIREHFRDLFRKLFGGGEGDIVLEDADDILECGIDIVVRPPGKELRSLSLLSGGEKTMTCVGLLLAIFKSRPSPFCLLDEVDAALDEANIGRFVNVLKEFKQTTQFIMITHRKPSMCEADVLYGVTMEQAGVSKRLNVRFDDVADDGSFVAAKRAA
jgi:chromosome segregation protein